MKIDFSNQASILSIFDDSNGSLEVNEDVTIEETLVRRLKDMRSLFVNTEGLEDEKPLYYMYNGIYREQHKEFFKKHKIRYEYTMLLNESIHGECIKAHGHIHGINPIKKARHIEAYEILWGEGYFELFKYDNDNLQVVLIQVKKGDYLIIPSEYYHLSINTGNEPFIFGDLIIEGADADYSHLKEMKGAPLFAFKDANGSVVFKENRNYNDHSLQIIYTTADAVPWDNPLAPIPLYAHFLANPEHFEFLK